MPNGEIPGPPPPESTDSTLKRLHRKESKLSKKLQNLGPDDEGFGRLYDALEKVKAQIEELKTSIPSAGPSPTTIDPSKRDIQGRIPWRKPRRHK
ncbi:hypothetical protein A3C98_00830 [Candidatus Roizmanbacteria bacterium RIFCSPHIGHO2_02_FULL_37_15]|uniref:Uncharacterized protein n=1 Tax=Candidatus Roizmanbacteria bacterium RIFCSPLOWO2_01_FULL_37_16 TaxID=1802058 RepID=A0A1F7IMN6_9BACT|nr:MAG: hypothetical protein A2859_03825 [Candidatus Roizmanbacteria bacterium RIFCSPHIGHO2_01_FULL_37_16b]OGK21368.1 MAG: hypothetical protein A3C98_00830 [Candidatus Roizmanbacteria bacterium RIFCSPHIGHO2_02_FULL_37_15]OGK33896.1 MAG: hypothetical protein A3F57_06270 [Candidatus Roizmanbacteria bacterium RIFCSPHIGHO2_12_FULL_36_11]OGK44636.1 MAG: hypothetical protein A3B40_02835 [Candidatus Roizmanbacteria bacterium RIFCSPLOWO2_01_FULL_37_16]OGK56803.1 MAG: hypothetical protein A3I50_02235 [C